MSSKCDRFSGPVASVKQEERKDPEDFDDLDSVRSGGEPGRAAS